MNREILELLAEAMAPGRFENEWDAQVYEKKVERGVNTLMTWLMEKGHVDLYDRLGAVLYEKERAA